MSHESSCCCMHNKRNGYAPIGSSLVSIERLDGQSDIDFYLVQKENNASNGASSISAFVNARSSSAVCGCWRRGAELEVKPSVPLGFRLTVDNA
ncbi:hypothetical protein EYF80_038357 [Liparis tanakae]|uniref:Uncharacterized protein n=1 Tax=Liparis tanakae TaxID=230148 RepID=A0A4Z2GE75_9TELE|nr:hypothetical protein EYF80_038357 [Liparis tanakae]